MERPGLAVGHVPSSRGAPPSASGCDVRVDVMLCLYYFANIFTCIVYIYTLILVIFIYFHVYIYVYICATVYMGSLRFQGPPDLGSLVKGH